MADLESMMRAGPGRAWLPDKPSTSLCSWTKQLGVSWGPGARSGLTQASHVILRPQPWTLGAQPNTQHQARQEAGGIYGSQGQPQPSGHPRPHPACPLPGLEQYPCKAADGCKTPGMPAVPPPQNTGPSYQLRISLKCFFLSFLHGVPRLNLILPENISFLFPGPGGYKAQGRFLRSFPWVITGSDYNIVLYLAQWHPYSKYHVA